MAASQRHAIDACTSPNYLVKCSNCLVVSFDGSGHEKTNSLCLEGKCRSRNEIYSTMPMPMFSLKIENASDNVYFLNKASGQFMEIDQVQDQTHEIHAPQIDGMFLTRKINGKTYINFAATTLNRFSVAIGFYSQGAFRVRFRFVVTATDGILCFPLYRSFDNDDGTYTIPRDFNINTALILGISTQEERSTVKIRVNANSINANVYYGAVSWNRLMDQVDISESLIPTKPGNKYRFNSSLYRLIGQPVRKFTSSKEAEENNVDSSCQNCAVLPEYATMPIPMTVPHYRSDIYAKLPLPLLNIGIDSKDVLFVLNKAKGVFEEIIVGKEVRPIYIHAHAVDGVFKIHETSVGNCEIALNATALKQFQLVVAYLCDGIWQLKCCIKITQKEGVVCFPLPQAFQYQNGVYTMPPDFSMTTALTLGIKPAAEQSTITLRVFANSSGMVDNDNGYEGHVVFHSASELRITESLAGGADIRFNKNLYALFDPPTFTDREGAEALASTSEQTQPTEDASREATPENGKNKSRFFQ